MIYFIDIDNTLTVADEPNAAPIQSRIDKVRSLLNDGHEVVLWSARGTTYALEFKQRNNINNWKCTGIGKPNVVIDDKPEIRKGGLKVLPPEELDR